MKTLTRQLRTEQGLSQKALAQKALVTNYVIQVLEGLYPAQTVEPQNIKKVADALEVSMEVLLLKKTRREEALQDQVEDLKFEALGLEDALAGYSSEVQSLNSYIKALEIVLKIVLFVAIAQFLILIF